MERRNAENMARAMLKAEKERYNQIKADMERQHNKMKEEMLRKKKKEEEACQTARDDRNANETRAYSDRVGEGGQ